MCSNSTEKNNCGCHSNVPKSCCSGTVWKNHGLQFTQERKRKEKLLEYLEELKSEITYVEEIIADMDKK